MKTKAVVILFPESEYLCSRSSCIPLFNECITKRYIEKGFDLVVVRYKGYRSTSRYTGGIINIDIDRIIDADITSIEQLTQYADFKKIAEEINKKEYEKIVVGGFHCFDCVEKLAKQVYKLNRNTTIDTDLTDLFDFASRYYNGWDIAQYKPELRFENSRRLINNKAEIIIDQILNKYNHRIWGIPKEYMRELKEEISRNKEEVSLE